MSQLAEERKNFQQSKQKTCDNLLSWEVAAIIGAIKSDIRL